MIRGDRRRLARVLANLIDNANAYGGGEPGGHDHRRQPARRAADATCRSASRTTDPGVPVEERALIFERFARGATAGRRSGSEGAGLGLALVDEHVRIHGGRVWVEDRRDGDARRPLRHRAAGHRRRRRPTTRRTPPRTAAADEPARLVIARATAAALGAVVLALSVRDPARPGAARHPGRRPGACSDPVDPPRAASTGGSTPRLPRDGRRRRREPQLRSVLRSVDPTATRRARRSCSRARTPARSWTTGSRTALPRRTSC